MYTGTGSKVSPMDWNNEASFVTTTETEDCSDRSSVMALAVACALLIILYCATVVCLCLRKSADHPKIVLPPEHIPGRSCRPSMSSSLAGSTTSFGMATTHDYVR